MKSTATWLPLNSANLFPPQKTQLNKNNPAAWLLPPKGRTEKKLQLKCIASVSFTHTEHTVLHDQMTFIL